jgi:hypothetical protein
MLLLQKQQSPWHLFIVAQFDTAIALSSTATAWSSEQHLSSTHFVQSALVSVSWA